MPRGALHPISEGAEEVDLIPHPADHVDQKAQRSHSTASLAGWLVAFICRLGLALLKRSWLIVVPLPVVVLIAGAAVLLWPIPAPIVIPNTHHSISLQSILSVDERPGSEIVKLDEQGRWELFEGISVIMTVHTQLDPAFRRLFDRVRRDHSALLTGNPYSSYHVTLCTLFLRRDWNQSEYNRLVTTERLRMEQLKGFLAAETKPVTFHLSGVWWNTAGLSIDLQTSTAADNATLQHYEAVVAGILGPLYVRMERYHMGFSYIVHSRVRVNGSEEELSELVASLPHHFKGVSFVAAPPRIVSFSTMLRFNPV